MKISPWFWIPALVLGLVVAIWVGARGAISFRTVISARFPEVQWVDSATLSQWARGAPGTQPEILDVRTEAEFEVSHLQGARRVDPDDPKIESLQIAPDATVVVYCSVGYRSAAIIKQLQRAGITNVYNLEGGIFAWANDDRPLYRDQERTSVVHPYDELWGRFLRKDLRATGRK
ncbi:MAG: sulfurtransferase [Deltaproteobacteria bacterium]|nr:MAG: sulfurtransferase [Deltaproteobacteria bacterium]